MKGSVTEGDHNVNAGENSVILESANYNAIFGGEYNNIKNSDYNTILNGCRNDVLCAVFSCVFGSGNVLTESKSPACRMLVVGKNTIVAGGATSEIFAEISRAENVYQSSVMGYACDIRNMYCAHFVGQNTNNVDNEIKYSDVIASAMHHMPNMVLSRAIVADDHSSMVPSSLSYELSVTIHYSDIIGHSMLFLKKK